MLSQIPEMPRNLVGLYQNQLESGGIENEATRDSGDVVFCHRTRASP